VTNVAPLAYAFGQVQQALTQLPGSPPPISISLQMDLLVSPSFGDDPKTAPLMWSRQLLGQALPNKIMSVNTYPDQWGTVTINQVPTSCTGGSFPSCVGAANAVLGQALLSGCVDDPRYRDPVTGKIAHTIDNYFTRLRTYYPSFDLVIAETGWHTAGTCKAYNDCTSTYSAAEAARYYQDLYAYVQQHQIPLLAFQPFDQKTKVCDSNGEMAEANYGVFSNFCQLKGGLTGLLPPAGPGSLGPNLAAFNALLEDDGPGKSCRPQTLVSVIGVAQSSVSHHLSKLRQLGLVREERAAGFTYYSLAVDAEDVKAPLVKLAVDAEDESGDRARLTDLLRQREDRQVLNERCRRSCLRSTWPTSAAAPASSASPSPAGRAPWWPSTRTATLWSRPAPAPSARGGATSPSSARTCTTSRCPPARPGWW
jgi:DNA-binding transcriptional ArsR family regulator